MNTGSPAVVTGLGCVQAGGEAPACDPTPFLKVRKNRKFMGVQDDLAVLAAGRALASAGLAGQALGPRSGLYLAVGYIPFEREALDALLAGSLEDGRFSMARFAERGMAEANPLLTFRCLPNMPAFHVSVNCDLQGPYFVTYPGAGQFYVALEEALRALGEGRIDRALVGGVAHQRNFLVERHYARLDPPVAAERLADAGGFLVLETPAMAASRGAEVRAQLLAWEVTYRPKDPFADTSPTAAERGASGSGEDLGAVRELGPAELPVLLARAAGRPHEVRHAIETRDGLRAASRWEVT